MSAFLAIATAVIGILILVGLLKIAFSVVVLVIGLAIGVAAYLLAESVLGRGR